MIMEKVIESIEKKVSVRTFGNPLRALEQAKRHAPDLVLTDYRTPHLDGVAFVRSFRGIQSCEGTPIVVITHLADKSVRYQALNAGATDFIAKPIDNHELRIRCRNLLTMRRQQRMIERRTEWLERQATQAIHETSRRETEALRQLARVGVYRQEHTMNYVLRLSGYARLIAEGLGLSEDKCSVIEKVAPMHDVGKVGVPDDVLQKSTTLSQSEWRVMKTHVAIGYEMLCNCASHYLKSGALVALRHHEKYDGTGYPDGLKGDNIPLYARIVAVADVYDALRSKRPYKSAWAKEKAVSYLRAQKGAHLDPRCVDAFLARLNDVVEIDQRYPRRYSPSSTSGSSGGTSSSLPTPT